MTTRLRLYVTGNTPTSDRLVERLHSIMDGCGDYELEVLNVFDHPELATEDMVLATPTLIRLLPPPVCRLVGDMGQREHVLAGLNIVQDGANAS